MVWGVERMLLLLLSLLAVSRVGCGCGSEVWRGMLLLLLRDDEGGGDDDGEGGGGSGG